jgi:hypothetical protein
MLGPPFEPVGAELVASLPARRSSVSLAWLAWLLARRIGGLALGSQRKPVWPLALPLRRCRSMRLCLLIVCTPLMPVLEEPSASSALRSCSAWTCTERSDDCVAMYSLSGSQATPCT